MMDFAVIGNPIAHSLSPEIHQAFARQCHLSLTYGKLLGNLVAFEDQVRAFFHDGGRGLNVTAPFKQRAFALCEVKTARAEVALAANTLWIKDNRLHADNTDGVGLVRDLSRYVVLSGSRILILGAGGVVQAILGALLAENPESVTLVNRTEAKSVALCQAFPGVRRGHADKLTEPCDLVLNATGMRAPSEQTAASWLQYHPFCYDLSYQRNTPTPFVAWAKQHGCQAQDGYGMLREQAAEAFAIWHGVRPGRPLL